MGYPADSIFAKKLHESISSSALLIISHKFYKFHFQEVINSEFVWLRKQLGPILGRAFYYTSVMFL